MLALALAASLTFAAVPVDDYNAVRQNGNNTGLAVLGAWALASTITGAVGLATTHDPQWQGVHLANLAWGVVNIGFAVVGLFMGLRPGATRTDFAGALEDGRSTQHTYAWNAALDVGYMAVAALMWLNFKDPRVVGFAQGSMVQALWLFAFDSTMAAFHQLNNERLLH